MVSRQALELLMSEVHSVMSVLPIVGPLLGPGFAAVSACIDDNGARRLGKDECPGVPPAIAAHDRGSQPKGRRPDPVARSPDGK